MSESEITNHTDALSPVSNLPPEILSEIFIALAIENYLSSQQLPQPGTNNMAALKYTTVSGVCKFWRMIAQDTPRVWSNINVSQVLNLEEHLFRSRKAPLYIYIDRSPAEKISMVLEESSRIKELGILTGKGSLREFSAPFTVRVNSLERLSLSEDRFGSNLSHSPLPVLFQGHTPNLRHLCIRDVDVAWDNPVFCSTLTHIDIRSIAVASSFRQFMDALDNLQALEDLKLGERAIPKLEEDVARSQVTLPNLRKLSLNCDATTCANFLDHVSLPANIRLNVRGYRDEGVEKLMRAFYEVLQVPLLTVVLCTERSLHSESCRVQGWRTLLGGKLLDTPPVPDVKLILVVSPGALQSPMLQPTLLGSVRQLNLDVSPFIKWDWKGFFECTALLDLLSITYRPPHGLFEALANVEDGKDGGCGSVLLKQLRTMQLQYMNFRPPARPNKPVDLLQPILDCLIQRARNLGAPIAKLEFLNCLHLTPADVVQFKEVVPDVDCDGPGAFPYLHHGHCTSL